MATAKQELLRFVDALMKEKGLTSRFPPNKQTEIREKISQEIDKEILLAFLNELSEHDFDIAEQMLDRNVSDEELKNFFDKKIPNQASLIAEVLINYGQNFKI